MFTEAINLYWLSKFIRDFIYRQKSRAGLLIANYWIVKFKLKFNKILHMLWLLSLRNPASSSSVIPAKTWQNTFKCSPKLPVCQSVNEWVASAVQHGQSSGDYKEIVGERAKASSKC